MASWLPLFRRSRWTILLVALSLPAAGCGDQGSKPKVEPSAVGAAKAAGSDKEEAQIRPGDSKRVGDVEFKFLQVRLVEGDFEQFGLHRPCWCVTVQATNVTETQVIKGGGPEYQIFGFSRAHDEFGNELYDRELTLLSPFWRRNLRTALDLNKFGLSGYSQGMLPGKSAASFSLFPLPLIDKAQTFNAVCEVHTTQNRIRLVWTRKDVASFGPLRLPEEAPPSRTKRR